MEKIEAELVHDNNPYNGYCSINFRGNDKEFDEWLDSKFKEIEHHYCIIEHVYCDILYELWKKYINQTKEERI